MPPPRDWIARQMSSAITAPTTDPSNPAVWTAPSSMSAPKMRYPRKPPMSEPTRPSTSVPPIPIGSSPGTSSRASAPAMRPMMSQPMIQSMCVPFAVRHPRVRFVVADGYPGRHVAKPAPRRDVDAGPSDPYPARWPGATSGAEGMMAVTGEHEQVAGPPGSGADGEGASLVDLIEDHYGVRFSWRGWLHAVAFVLALPAGLYLLS